MRTSWLTCESGAWREALRRLRHDVYHLPAYVRAAARQEGGAGCAFLAEEGEACLLLPLLVRPVAPLEGDATPWFDAASPYGYPGPLLAVPPGAEAFARRAVEALVQALGARRIVSLFVRLHPLLPLPPEPLVRAGALVRHGDTISIDLALPEAARRRQTRASTRAEIRQARRAGLAVAHDPAWEAFDDFFEIYHQTMARVAAHPSYHFERAYFLALRDALGAALHLFVVRAGTQVAAAALFTETDGIVQYFFSGTRTAHLGLHPAKLLLDHVRAWAGARGNAVLHLGGGVGAQEDSLFRFKAGFSPRRHPFHTWRVVVHPARYEALCRRRFPGGPSPQDDFFPRYRAPEA